MHVRFSAPRRRTSPALVWALVAAGLPGCGGCEGDGGDGAGLPPRGVAPAAPPPAPSAPAPADPAPDPAGDRPRLADGADDDAPAAPSHGARDLEGELSRAFGTPTDCFPAAFVTRNPGTLTVTVVARFPRDGEASNVRVTAPGAPESVRRCLEARAAGIRLPAPIPEAPRRVEAIIPFELSVEPVPGEPAGEGPGARIVPGAPGEDSVSTTSSALRQRLETRPPTGGELPTPPPSSYALPPGFGED